MLTRPTNDGQYPSTAKDLLEHFKYQKNRQLDPNELLSATKIAHITLTINNLGTDPSWAKRLTENDYKKLYEKSADELIKDIKRFPEKYPKSLLMNIATEHFIRGLNINREAFQEGIRAAAKLEGVHSRKGRVTVAEANTAAFIIDSVGRHFEDVYKAQKDKKNEHIAHWVTKGLSNAFKIIPQFGYVPAETGTYRIVTDVQNTFLRVGGSPNAAKNISGHMDTHLPKAQELNTRFDQLNERLTTELHSGNNKKISPKLLEDIKTAYKDAAALDKDIQETYSSYKVTGFGKLWGGVGNLFAGIPAILSAAGSAVEDDKQRWILKSLGLGLYWVAPYIQWGAGWLDEATIKHQYAISQNVLLGDYWKDGVLTPVLERTVSDLNEGKFRATWTSLPEQIVKAIQEVYEHELAEVKLRIRNFRDQNSLSAVEHGHLRDALTQRDVLIGEIAKFESFDEKQWATFSSTGLINECITNPQSLEDRLIAIRKIKPGERASQISQRYYHAFHGLIISPAALTIIADVLNLLPLEEATKLWSTLIMTGVGQAIHFTGLTFEVRVQKADNKGPLSEVSASLRRTHAQVVNDNHDYFRETVTVTRADGSTFTKNINMTKSSACDRSIHDTFFKQWKRILSIAPKNLFSGFTGMYYTGRVEAAMWPVNIKAQAMMTRLSEVANLERPFNDDGWARKEFNLAAIHDQVSTYGLKTKSIDRELVAERRKILNIGTEKPLQWNNLPTYEKEELAVNVSPERKNKGSFFGRRTQASDPEKGTTIIVGTSTNIQNDPRSDRLEKSLREFFVTERANDIDKETFIEAFQILVTGADGKETSGAIRRAFEKYYGVGGNDRIANLLQTSLGVDIKAGAKQSFWNAYWNSLTDAPASVVSLIPNIPPLVVDHFLAEHRVARAITSILGLAVTGAMQTAIEPILTASVTRYIKDRTYIGNTAGAPNIAEIFADTPSFSEVIRRLEAASRNNLTAINDASANKTQTLLESINAKRNYKMRKALIETDTEAGLKTYSKWVRNFGYYLAPIIGHAQKSPLTTLGILLGTLGLTKIVLDPLADAFKNEADFLKMLKACAEFQEIRTQDAIDNNRQIMVWEEGRLVPNKHFTADDIDASKVRRIWQGYCQLRLDYVAIQIDNMIAERESVIADLYGLSLDEYKAYEAFKPGEDNLDIETYRNSKEMENAGKNWWDQWRALEERARQPLTPKQTQRLQQLQEKKKSNAMSLQMWAEGNSLYDNEGELLPNLTPDQLSRLEYLRSLVDQSLEPHEWKELQILERASTFIPVAAASRGQQAILANITSKIRTPNDAQISAHQNSIQHLKDQKLRLNYDWSSADLDDNIKTLIENSLRGGHLNDDNIVYHARNAAHNSRSTIASQIYKEFGKNMQGGFLLGDRLPLIANAAYEVASAIIETSPISSNAKQNLNTAVTAIHYVTETYKTLQTAIQPLDTIEFKKRQAITIAGPAGTVIANTDGSGGVTQIGPAGTVIVDPGTTVTGPSGVTTIPGSTVQIGPAGTIIIPSPSITPPATLTTSSISASTITGTISGSSTITSSVSSTITSAPNTISATPTTTTSAPPTQPTGTPGGPNSSPPSQTSKPEIPLKVIIGINTGLWVISNLGAYAYKYLSNDAEAKQKEMLTAEEGHTEVDPEHRYLASIGSFGLLAKSMFTGPHHALKDLRTLANLEASETRLRRALAETEESSQTSLPPSDKKEQKARRIDRRISTETLDEKPSEVIVKKFGEIEERTTVPKQSGSGWKITEAFKATTSTAMQTVTGYLWNNKPASTPEVEEWEFSGNAKEFVEYINSKLKGTNFEKPEFEYEYDLTEGEEKDTIQVKWEYKANGVTYLHDVALTEDEAKRFNELRRDAESSSDYYAPFEDYWTELQAKALEKWFAAQATAELKLKIKWVPGENTLEKLPTKVKQDLSIYLATEGMVDEKLRSDLPEEQLTEENREAQKKAYEKFVVVYQAFDNFSQENSSCNFQQWLVLYYEGQQKQLEEEIKELKDREKTPEALVKLDKYRKLELINTLLKNHNPALLSSVSPQEIENRKANYEMFFEVEKHFNSELTLEDNDSIIKFSKIYAQHLESNPNGLFAASLHIYYESEQQDLEKQFRELPLKQKTLEETQALLSKRSKYEKVKEALLIGDVSIISSNAEIENLQQTENLLSELTPTEHSSVLSPSSDESDLEMDEEIESSILSFSPALSTAGSVESIDAPPSLTNTASTVSIDDLSYPSNPDSGPVLDFASKVDAWDDGTLAFSESFEIQSNDSYILPAQVLPAKQDDPYQTFPYETTPYISPQDYVEKELKDLLDANKSLEESKDIIAAKLQTGFRDDDLHAAQSHLAIMTKVYRAKIDIDNSLDTLLEKGKFPTKYKKQIAHQFEDQFSGPQLTQVKTYLSQRIELAEAVAIDKYIDKLLKEGVAPSNIKERIQNQSDLSEHKRVETYLDDQIRNVITNLNKTPLENLRAAEAYIDNQVNKRLIKEHRSPEESLRLIERDIKKRANPIGKEEMFRILAETIHVAANIDIERYPQGYKRVRAESGDKISGFGITKNAIAVQVIGKPTQNQQRILFLKSDENIDGKKPTQSQKIAGTFQSPSGKKSTEKVVTHSSWSNGSHQ